METIADIKQAIAQFRSDSTYIKLRNRWDEDFNLYRMKPFNAGRGYFSYTSNSPRILADKLVSLLCESKLLIRVPEDILSEDEQNTANNVERFLYGALNLMDEQALLLPDEPEVRQKMAWLAVIRGSFGVRSYVYKDEKGETIPSMDIWDIYNTSFGVDSKGVTWAAYSYRVTPEQAKEEYNITNVPAHEIRYGTNAVDFWSRTHYGRFIGDQWATPLKKHDLGYCPVSIIRVGATPAVWQPNYQFTGAHMGESVFAANRGLYPSLNKTLSDLMTLVRRGVKVPMGYWSADGTKTIEEDIFQVDKAAIVPLQHNDKLEPIMTQTMPADASPLLNWESGEMQRGGISHTNFGELGFRLSGFAINQLQAALASVVSPFGKAIEQAYQIHGLWLIDQYSKGGFKPVEVRGRTSRDQTFGYPIVDKIKPSDIDGRWHPEFSLEQVMPKDDAQSYQLASFARDGEIPLLSDETIRGELLGVQDTDLESDKIAREWANKLPIPKLFKAYVNAWYEGRPDEAQNILAELQRLMQATAPQGARPQGQQGRQPTRLQRESAGTPGTGIPPGPTGMSSNVLPSETQGGMPSGALSARIPSVAEEEA